MKTACEMRAEFSATRNEIVAGDERVVAILREEIRARDDRVTATLREEVGTVMTQSGFSTMT
jgi:hypothetical protein